LLSALLWAAVDMVLLPQVRRSDRMAPI